MKKTRIRAALASVLSVITLALSPISAMALGSQVNGTLYYDQNNNGVQDGTEKGVPGIVVSYGYGTTQKTGVSDANGHYVISGTTGSARVTVHAGWFRSACNSLNCTVGAPGGNDFPVANQFISLAGVNGAAGATLNAGLVPDWGSSYPIPASPTAHPVDIAARLTYSSGCTTDSTRVCSSATPILNYVQFHNQGTSDLSNPIFSLELPAGHAVDDASWTDPKNTNNIANPLSNSITVLEPFNEAKGYGLYKLNGTIPAGANSSMAFNVNVLSTVTPTATPLPTSDPYDKQPVLRVVSMDQTGDPDSDICTTNGPTWRTGSCAFSKLGVHDRTQPTDSTDGTGWNVSASGTALTPAYDLALKLTLAAGQTSNIQAGDTVNYSLQVYNQGNKVSDVRNVKLVDYIPSDMTFDPADNPGWTVQSGLPTTFITSILASGDSINVPIKLHVNNAATTNDNGTAALKNRAEIASFNRNFPSGNGIFGTATDIDSTPDSDPANDGSEVDDEINNAGGDQDDADYENVAISSASSTTEYVTNPSVETSLTGWTDIWNPSTTTQSRVTEAAHAGSYSLRTDTSSSTGAAAGFYNYTPSKRWVTSTQNGQTYTASTWVKASQAGLNICVRETEFNGSTNAGYTEKCAVAPNTDWYKITNTKTALAAGDSLATAVYTPSMKTGTYFLADDFSLTAPAADTPPTAPTNLTATATSTTNVNLTWTGSTDDHGVASYTIYRDGVAVGNTTNTNFTDSALTANTTYNYVIKAVDTAAQQSAASIATSATTYQEYVTNPSVETTPYGWADLWNPANTVQTRTSEDAHSGSYSLRTDTTSTTGTAAGFYNYTPSTRWVSATASGKAYTASAWVKASKPGLNICVRQTEFSGPTNVGFTETCTLSADTNWFRIANTKTALTNGDSLATAVYTTWMKSSDHFLADDFSVSAAN